MRAIRASRLPVKLRLEARDIVNNAGTGILKYFVENTEADWDLTLDVNLKGVFLCCRRVVPEVSKHEGNSLSSAQRV